MSPFVVSVVATALCGSAIALTISTLILTHLLEQRPAIRPVRALRWCALTTLFSSCIAAVGAAALILGSLP